MGLRSGFLPSGLATKTLHAPLLSSPLLSSPLRINTRDNMLTFLFQHKFLCEISEPQSCVGGRYSFMGYDAVRLAVTGVLEDLDAGGICAV